MSDLKRLLYNYRGSYLFSNTIMGTPYLFSLHEVLIDDNITFYYDFILIFSDPKPSAISSCEQSQ